MRYCFDMRGFLLSCAPDAERPKDERLGDCKGAREEKGIETFSRNNVSGIERAQDDRLVSRDDIKQYSLTRKGEKELKGACAISAGSFTTFLT